MTDVEKEGDAYEFDPSISEEEREFYLKAYPSPDYVRDRKAHCTTCKVHIGTAPCNEHGIKMHPILRVTHCNRCHAFYNSGEFSKGEDGSELYCRWCGQGGEVYCCSNCPYVFCKSCITKNLSRGVVADIEQNENWRCFGCAPKILWPLRALHWALMNYIEKQKKEIDAMDLSEADKKVELSKDRSTCCRLAKAKCGNMSDSLESVDSLTSRRSSSSSKKKPSTQPSQTPPAKRPKTSSNDEVVCTPDLLSMLEPDCQITVQAKQPARVVQPVTTPKIFTVQQSYVQPQPPQQRSSAPPPLVLRNTGIQLRPVANPPVIRRTVVSPRTPAPSGSNSPVYHTINGYRIDLNSAAQQGTYRLPNGKLIQVKRQSGPTASANNVASTPVNNWSQSQTPQRVLNTLPTSSMPRTVQIAPQRPFVAVQSQPVVPGISVQQQPSAIRYPSGMIGNTVIAPFNHNGPQIQMINGVSTVGAPASQVGSGVSMRPTMIRHTFPDNQVGQARTRLQDQIFNAMEICQHLTGKLQTLTNSNAYKQARNLMEVKELYIHLSYLLTYAIGRYKGLQDKCLTDMRQLGFANDADSLENGQIAADKQASDDEDNEIEIVEPKTDTINLDSDNEDQVAVSSTAKTSANSWNNRRPVTITPAAPVQTAEPTEATNDISAADEMTDFMDAAHNILASMLEIDIVEGNDIIMPTGSSPVKKQPRKKTTNKPNPTLVKQKKLMEYQKLEDMKRNDVKLKFKSVVIVKKAEDEFPYTVGILKQRYEKRKEIAKRIAAEKALQEQENPDKNKVHEILNENGTQEKSIQLMIDNSNEKDKQEKTDDVDEGDKTADVDKADKIDDTDKADKVVDTDKADITDDTDKVDITEDTDKADITDDTDKAVVTDDTDKTDKIDETNKVDKIDDTDKVEKTYDSITIDETDSAEKQEGVNEKKKCEVNTESGVIAETENIEKAPKDQHLAGSEENNTDKPIIPAIENECDMNDDSQYSLDRDVESLSKNDQVEKPEEVAQENQTELDQHKVTKEEKTEEQQNTPAIENKSDIDDNLQSYSERDNEEKKNDAEEAKEIAQDEEDIEDVQMESKTSPVDNVEKAEKIALIEKVSTDEEGMNAKKAENNEEFQTQVRPITVEDPSVSQSLENQEVMETNEEENDPNNSQNESSQLLSSNTANDEQQSNNDPAQVTQETHTDNIEHDKNSQNQTEDIEMTAEPDIKELSRNSYKSDKVEMASAQNTSINNEDHDMDSNDRSDTKQLQEHDSIMHDNSVEHMNIDTSKDIISKSPLNVDTTLISSNKDVQETVETNTNIAQTTPQPMSVVTNVEEQ